MQCCKTMMLNRLVGSLARNYSRGTVIPTIPSLYHYAHMNDALMTQYPAPTLNQIARFDKDKMIAVPQVDKRGFRVSVDVAGFHVNELTVKALDDKVIVIEGKSEELQENYGSFASNHFVRKYTVPNGYDISKAVSTLTPEGLLTINIPSPFVLDNAANERVIPIQTGLSPIGSENQNEQLDHNAAVEEQNVVNPKNPLEYQMDNARIPIDQTYTQSDELLTQDVDNYQENLANNQNLTLEQRLEAQLSAVEQQTGAHDAQQTAADEAAVHEAQQALTREAQQAAAYEAQDVGAHEAEEVGAHEAHKVGAQEAQQVGAHEAQQAAANIAQQAAQQTRGRVAKRDAQAAQQVNAHKGNHFRKTSTLDKAIDSKRQTNKRVENSPVTVTRKGTTRGVAQETENIHHKTAKAGSRLTPQPAEVDKEAPLYIDSIQEDEQMIESDQVANIVHEVEQEHIASPLPINETSSTQHRASEIFRMPSSQTQKNINPRFQETTPAEPESPETEQTYKPNSTETKATYQTFKHTYDFENEFTIYRK